jgi:hypothetical protein
MLKLYEQTRNFLEEEMLKVIINCEAWDSAEYEEWKSSIGCLTAMDITEETKNLDNMSKKLERCWPWPESVEYLYDTNNRETIILTFNSTNDWDECKNSPEFEETFDFESLDFFTYLNVEICKVEKTVTKGSPGIY